MPAAGREGGSLLRIASSISLILISCAAVSYVLNADKVSSDVKLAKVSSDVKSGVPLKAPSSSSDLDWGAFNAQLSHDWYG
jgi:hypothetical protein